jgi:hypothetical protein
MVISTIWATLGREAQVTATIEYETGQVPARIWTLLRKENVLPLMEVEPWTSNT